MSGAVCVGESALRATKRAGPGISGPYERGIRLRFIQPGKPSRAASSRASTAGCARRVPEPALVPEPPRLTTSRPHPLADARYNACTMDAPRVQYAKTSDGVSIAYYAIGEGPPLVCLNPLAHLQLGWQRADEREWYERLARTRRLIRLDTRGLGLSQVEAAAVSMGGLTADLDAVVERLGVERFDLFTSLFLNRFAIHYAVHRPERVSKLVIWGVARTDLPSTPRLQATFAVRDVDPDLWYELTARGWLGAQEHALRDAMAYLKEVITPEVRRAYLGSPVGVRDLLPQVKCPTLVIFPRLNPDWAVEAARRNAAAIPDCQLVLYEGRYALPHVGEDLDTKLRIIDDFLGEQAALAARKWRDGSVGASPSAASTPHLSLRQREVLDLIASGKTNREIASDLVLSLRTVERHVNDIYARLGVRNRTEAAAFALKALSS